jgi:hypothetical protein
MVLPAQPALPQEKTGAGKAKAGKDESLFNKLELHPFTKV